MKKYYIYAHIKPNNGEIFYIGKGTGKRITDFHKRNPYWNKIKNKYGIQIIKLFENLNEQEAYKKEVKYIAHYKKLGLCVANITLGGDGVKVKNRWWGKKIGKSLKGVKRKCGSESKSYKDFITKEELERLYQNKNIIEISKICGLSTTTITNRLRKYNIAVKESGRKRIKVTCLNDNLKFNSLSEASNFYGVYRENISKVLKGKYKQTKGLKFIYETNK